MGSTDVVPCPAYPNSLGSTMTQQHALLLLGARVGDGNRDAAQGRKQGGPSTVSLPSAPLQVSAQPSSQCVPGAQRERGHHPRCYQSHSCVSTPWPHSHWVTEISICPFWMLLFFSLLLSFVVLGLNPRALCTHGKCLHTEPHP